MKALLIEHLGAEFSEEFFSEAQCEAITLLYNYPSCTVPACEQVMNSRSLGQILHLKLLTYKTHALPLLHLPRAVGENLLVFKSHRHLQQNFQDFFAAFLSRISQFRSRMHSVTLCMVQLQD